MVLYMNRYTIRPGSIDDFVKEINESGVEERFRAMPGNIKFDFAIPVKDADTLYMNDLWEDEATFEAHLHARQIYPIQTYCRCISGSYISNGTN